MTNLTVNFALTLKPVFAGLKNVYLKASDGTQATSLNDHGDFTVTANLAPTTMSVGTVPAGTTRTITFSYADGNGFPDLTTVRARINTTLSDANGCSFQYGRTTDTLSLYSDAGSAFVGSIVLAPGNSVQNSQCVVAAGNESGSGGTLGVTVTVTAKAGFTGAKTLYEHAQDAAGANSGWLAQGSWTIVATNHTITTNPAGLSLTVDGAACTTPCTVAWTDGTAHTIAAISPQPLGASTYWFSYWSDGGAQSHTITAPAAATTYTATMATDAVQAVRTCLSAGISAVCTIPVGQHLVTAPIQITRSNVTVTGGAAQRSQTKLVRAPSFTDPILRVGTGTALTGVVVENLTVCGSSTLTAGASPAGCPRTPSTCGQYTANWDTAPWHCVDIEVNSVDTGLWPANPFANSSPYSLTINNVDMEDATGHALSLFNNATANTRVNDVYIHHSAFNFS